MPAHQPHLQALQTRRTQEAKMALDAAKCAADFQKIASAADENTSPADSANKLAAAFHNYIKGGTLPGCNMQAGGQESLLVAAFTAPTLPATMGAAICSFLNTIFLSDFLDLVL